MSCSNNDAKSIFVKNQVSEIFSEKQFCPNSLDTHALLDILRAIEEILKKYSVFYLPPPDAHPRKREIICGSCNSNSRETTRMPICCSTNDIPLSLTEMLLIIEEIKSADHPSRILDDINRGMKKEGKSTCPFLNPDTKLCDIHSVRPAYCRFISSTSITICKGNDKSKATAQLDDIVYISQEFLRCFYKGNLDVYSLKDLLKIVFFDDKSFESWISKNPNVSATLNKQKWWSPFLGETS